MPGQRLQRSSAKLWELAKSQHGVISRAQLLELGLSRHAIHHRITKGRLHPVMRGVYAVGRPELSRHGRWMAAVLRCGPGAFLSHDSAAALWEIGTEPPRRIDVSVPVQVARRSAGIVVHRRSNMPPGDVTQRYGIPVTTPIATLIDIASRRGRDGLEAAINEADRLGLVDPETLRSTVGSAPARPGVGALRETLDRRTFTRTDSWLERRFLPIVRRAGLARPLTQQWVNGFRVDFYWPDLGLVVETDGLRTHRTPAEQARDRTRDQAHTAAGLTPLRFTHAQVEFEPRHVEATLAAVARRLRALPAR